MPDGSFPSPLTFFTRRQKAALLVQMLTADGAPMELSALPDAQQTALVRELAQIGNVSREVLDQVAQEFLEDLERHGLTGPDGISAALTTLADQLSPTVRDTLQTELNGVDPWGAIVGLDNDALVPLMLAEAPEVSAVALSKLPVSKAADLLGLLPGDLARSITFSMARTTMIAPATVEQMGLTLAQDYVKPRASAFDQGAPRRLGDILNSAQPATRDMVLATLEQDDPDFANDVKKAIFTFADIATRLAAVDVPKILRGVEQSVLVQAIGYGLQAGDELAQSSDHILANISQRMADQLKEDIQDNGPVKQRDGEIAQTELVSAIRMLVDGGDIVLFSADED